MTLVTSLGCVGHTGSTAHDDGGSTGALDDLSPRCTPPDGTSGSPGTIAEVVELLNALSRPVSLDCLLETFDRPLRMTATQSVLSLQPALGPRSPRVFLFSGDLVLSVAVEGDAAGLLEMGEPVQPGRSLKAEIALPLVEELSAASPFEHTVGDFSVSTCGVCHANEVPAVDAPSPTAFVSEVLRFRDDELVELEFLQDEWQACEPEREPERCARLKALFGHGDVVHQPFDPSLPTIYE